MMYFEVHFREVYLKGIVIDEKLIPVDHKHRGLYNSTEYQQQRVGMQKYSVQECTDWI